MNRLQTASAMFVAFSAITASTGHCAAVLSPLRLSWVRHPPVASPSPRAYMASAYDPVSEKFVIFGGYDAAYLSETWTYDGTTWTQEVTPLSPSPRSGASMAFDAVQGVLVLFGGYNGNPLDDTWLWNGATSTWTRAAPSEHPIGLSGPMLFTDPVNGHVDLFGGIAAPPDTFTCRMSQWNGSTWIHLQPNNSPPACAFAAVALDRSRGEVVLSGNSYGGNQTTWTWDGTDWTFASPTVPPTLFSSNAAFDPHLGHVVLYAGSGASATWEWTDGAWVALQPVFSPPGHWGVAMAYDEAVGSIVMFGGSGLIAPHETWWLAIQP
jgi:Galactose oxidase, central domain